MYKEIFMNIKCLKCFFLWCTIINFSLFFISFLMYHLCKKFIYKTFNRWYDISEDYFKKSYFAALIFFKILIIVFNFTPYLALELFY